MADFAITNARVVLPDRVLDRATVCVSGGLIEDVQATSRFTTRVAPEVIDAGGALLMPGLIDLHNDALELEVNPRPRARLPLPFALNNLERRLIAAGVTTEFHAIGFMERPAAFRTIDNARERSAYIAQLASGPPRAIEHHVLHRINVRDRNALDIVFDSLDSLPVRYASLDDHTPGQGQYRDVEKHHKHMEQHRAVRGGTPEGLDEVMRRMELAVADTATVPYVHERVRAESRLLPITLASHDDHTPEKVDTLFEVGAQIAEFPVALEAAERARERGMTIVVGAPNVLRGGSQSGNIAAGDLIRHGLADIICADYHAPSMLAAVFRIVDEGLRDIPSAVRMVTLTAAQAVGLTDRGSIQAGMRADLILVQVDSHGFPHVEATFTRGRRTSTFTAHGNGMERLAVGGALYDIA